MRKTLVCIISAGLLFTQGCQNKQVTETTNDDWVVGSWTNENKCTDDNYDMFTNDGVLIARIGGGAWRLKNDVLTLTFIYMYNADGAPDLRFEDNVIKLNVISHEAGRSMVTSMEGENGRGNWINCDKNKDKLTAINSSTSLDGPVDTQKNVNETPKFDTEQQILIDAFFKGEDMCRGGTEQSVVNVWCPKRDAAARAMNAAGICFGHKEDATSSEYKLHKCREGSNGFR